MIFIQKTEFLQPALTFQQSYSSCPPPTSLIISDILFIILEPLVPAEMLRWENITKVFFLPFPLYNISWILMTILKFVFWILPVFFLSHFYPRKPHLIKMYFNVTSKKKIKKLKFSFFTLYQTKMEILTAKEVYFGYCPWILV